MPQIFWNIAGMPTKFFGTVRQKVPTKPWCPPAFLCMKNFDERIFLKQHQSVFQWNVSVQWDKNFGGKSWYSPSPPPIQIFSVPEINETLKDPPLRKFFGTVRQKIFDGKLWYPLLCIKVFDTPKFLKHWGDAHEIFRHCETKNFRRKVVIPLLCIKFFDTPNFLKPWKDAHETFLHCETKNFRRKIVIPPFVHKFFRYPNFSETFKGCPRNFSALRDKKFSTENCDTPYYA